MNFTSYDDIMSCFVKNCGVDTSNLPTDEEKLYGMIQNGLNHYNVYLKDESPIQGDDDTEMLNTSLDGTRLLILAFCLKYVYLENQLVGFQELWSPFQNELGIKNYKAQVDGREKTLERTRQKIIELVTTIEDVNIM